MTYMTYKDILGRIRTGVKTKYSLGRLSGCKEIFTMTYMTYMTYKDSLALSIS